MKTINRISKKDTIEATSYDCNGNYIAKVYDSGFHTISQVISALNQKGGGWCKKINQVLIVNKDKEWLDRYTASGRKL